MHCKIVSAKKTYYISNCQCQHKLTQTNLKIMSTARFCACCLITLHYFGYF